MKALFGCIALSAVMLMSFNVTGQVTTGTPLFGSFGGGPFDTTNLGNLNVHFAVPVRHKAGRGTPFSYDLTYDNSIWTPVASGGSTSWQPAVGAGNWGWQGLTPSGAAWIQYSWTYSSGNCYFGGVTTYQEWNYSGFVYHDLTGTSHSFGASAAYYLSPGGGSCPPNGPEPPTAHPSSADGYTLTVYPGAGSVGTTLTDSKGNTINAPLSTTPPTGGSYSSTDRNGNQITATNGVWTDTLGTTALSVTGSAPSNTTLSYTAPSGASAPYTVSYKSYTVATAFSSVCSTITDYSQANIYLVDKITLPDSTFYQFTYETSVGASVSARIAQVTLPTGGTIQYTYGPINCADGSATSLTRTLNPGGAWTYSRVKTGTDSHWQTTIQDPTTAQNQTTIDFQQSGNNFYETQRIGYQGLVSANNVLSTAITCYNTANPTPASCPTTAIIGDITRRTLFTYLPTSTGVQAETDIQYSSGFTGDFPTEVDSYDYGAKNSGQVGTLIRKVIPTYSNYFYGAVLPTSVKVEDANSVVQASTTYSYDQTGLTQTTGTPQHITQPVGLGNLTTLATQVSGSVTLYRRFTYYDTGTMKTSTDAGTSSSGGPNLTTYNYTSPSCGNSFVTSISEPLSLSRSFTWNCTGGVLTAIADENTKTVSASYTTDTHFWRPESASDQLANLTNYSYPSSTAVESSMLFNSSSSTVDRRATLDDFGRPILFQVGQTPTPSNYDSVETDYDVAGRVTDATRAYAATASTLCTGSCPKTTVTYDGLNRPLVVTDAGTGTVTYAYTNMDVLQTVGPAPTGENTKRRQLEYDGLGRLKSVCEVTSATGSGTCSQVSSQPIGFWTKYTYDVLGDRVGVTQNAQAAAGSQETRTYTFDMIGRLTSELNPETGTTAITYTYDTLSADASCGTVTSAGDLLKKVDAMGNVSCNKYDAWHRVTSVTYPTGTYASATPTKCYVYDAATVNGTAVLNAKTRLAEGYTTATTCAAAKLTDEGFSYSARGEINDAWESTPHSSGYYHLTSLYWANGKINTLSGLPSLATMTYGVDGEGRTSTVSAGSGQNPVTASSYNVAHQVTGVTYGSLDSDAFTFDPNTGRMTQYQFKMGTGPTTDTGALTWNANGSLQKLQITDNIVTANSQTCTYGQDDLMRITKDNCGTGWAQTFSFDPFGNLSKSGSASFLPTYTGSSGTGTSPTNQYYPVSSYYDTNGNLTSDAAHTYTWDADANNISVDGSVVGMTYDALDRMVEQTRGSAHTEIVYSPQGLKLALMNGQTLVNAFVKLPGGGRAVYNNSGLAYYRHKDHLGNSRLATTPTRTKYYDVAYGPYGEDYNGSGTTADLSFTDQNQDTVAGGWTANLYDFMLREYRTGHGRWTSPDPSGLAAVDPSNPQSWNRYAYVLNNPMSLIDPFGDDCYDENGNAMSCPPGVDDGSYVIVVQATAIATVVTQITVTAEAPSVPGVPIDPGPSQEQETPTTGPGAVNNGPPGMPKPPNQILKDDQRKQKICATMAKVSNGATGMAKASGVLGLITVGTIVATGGTDAPLAAPVAGGFAVASGSFQALSLINTAVANWGLGCENSW